MSVRRTAMGQRNRLLDCMPATSLLLALMMVVPVRAQEEAARVDVTAADNAAAVYSASNFFYHVLPSATPAGKMGAASHNFGVSKPASVTTTLSAAATIPRVPAPGFYGEDLKYFGGHVLKTVTSNNIYVNESSCGGSVASCWGNPREFIEDLSNSNMIHITDQYVGATWNNRYPAGTSSQASIPLFSDNVVGQNDILAVVHAVAKKLGTGYGHIYHVFLPKGVDTCFDLTNICYSPDNLPTFVFCAYHGSVDFSDIGHVLVSVEPYQDVLGCAVAPPNPNGQKADSTNSVLSHELFEAITDPDPGSGWVSFNSLITAGAEIGDLCEPLGTGPPNFWFIDPTIQLGNGKFQLQGEYSNKYHACAFTP